jgi:hypothetical protein
VHHRDHNHDNNPPDGSNWELLCLYCHDNEHQRQLEATQGNVTAKQPGKAATHNPFAALAGLIKRMGADISRAPLYRPASAYPAQGKRYLRGIF